MVTVSVVLLIANSIIAIATIRAMSQIRSERADLETTRKAFLREVAKVALTRRARK